MAHWIKLVYDRNTYIIDLDRVSAFCYTPNGRISLAVLDGNVTLVINPQSDPVTYQMIVDYIETNLGLSLP